MDDKPDIIPDVEGQRINMTLLLSVGMTENGQIGVYWHPGPLVQRLRDLSPSMKQATVDQLITAVNNSIRKRIPCIIIVP